ncbi:MAG: hypothetical protein LBC42_00860 [Puniceicoccales bacterium]|jgi:hypothetical protein|nr:hypothetical protein [Puniceicoccales bacterium]
MSVAVEAVTAVGGTSTTASAFGTAQVGDIDQFMNAMNANVPRPARGQVADAEKEMSIYEKMLSPINEFKVNFDRIMGNIGIIVRRGQLNMADLIQVQFQLTQLAYMNDLAAKTADKISQGAQTLFRNQG